MASEEDLPFGRTEITATQYAELVDRSKAENLLAENGVGDPATKINRFITAVPELLRWLSDDGRCLPWRHTVDPWTVYATEILLQRTRAGAVEDIYEEFFNRYPTPQALYSGDEEVLRDTVRSLGFVNHRTRSLSEAAEMCVIEYDGDVPDSLDALKQPWRVGDYSARACLVFAFGCVQPLVDTNFARVIERVLGYEMPNQPHKSKTVYKLLGALVPAEPSAARAFNFAILDIGAMICSPDSPDCESCPLSSGCEFASQNQRDD